MPKSDIVQTLSEMPKSVLLGFGGTLLLQTIYSTGTSTIIEYQQNFQPQVICVVIEP